MIIIGNHCDGVPDAVSRGPRQLGVVVATAPPRVCRRNIGWGIFPGMLSVRQRAALRVQQYAGELPRAPSST